MAIDKFEETGRPLRIAIDISIWQFQIQAGQGGSNPAIRTFYYRLLRLISASVQPLFVFDGPNKPPFKRNKRTGHHGASIPNMMCKKLLKLFGFPSHTAPGEAEAECAYLQREGVVDAVLSEDVDTLMFGCGVLLRNWSSEGTRGNKSPTHVSLYDAKATKEGKSGLDREGMILVALMSGGDYITEGIPGCGVKVACEAARAGFGRSLCTLSRSDSSGLETWRMSLARELETNESKFFRVRHKALNIPANFPNKEVLGYYTHPIVSSAAKVETLKKDIVWDGQVDIEGLRKFVGEAFDWTHKTGARKFIRGLAPVLLVQKLRIRGNRRESGYGDLVLTAMNEMGIVRAICGKRTHFSTDGIPELRVIYHPNDIVGLDLDAEEEDEGEDYGRDGLAPINDEDQIEAYVSDDATTVSRSSSPSKRAASQYDPTQPDKLWIPETIAKIGVPLKVEDYEESLRDPKKFMKAKAAAKKAATKGGMPRGAMDKFVKVSKPITEGIATATSRAPLKTVASSSQPLLPPIYLAPTLERLTSSQNIPPFASRSGRSESTRPVSGRASTRDGNDSNETVSKPVSKATSKSRTAPTRPQPRSQSNANPWTLAKSSPSNKEGPSITKRLYRSVKPTSQATDQDSNSSSQPLDLTSSPPSSSYVPRPKKHPQSPQRENTHSTQEATSSPPPPSTSHHDLERTVPASPRKKTTPAKSPLSPKHPTASLYSTPKSTHKQASRRLNFSPDPCSPPEDISSSPALPALGDILPIAREKESGREVVSISSSPAPSPEKEAEPHMPGVNTSPRRKTPRKPAVVREATIEAEDVVRDVPEFEDLHPADLDPEPVVPVKERKKYIMLRESLPGGWKEVGEEEVPVIQGRGRRERAWRVSQVEVLDMTGV